ncbi:murein hydrolase activator EnvC family protein [Bacillus sp. PS06]|uniref:murein hydrolase activator EnvC family protein n=1 Tax=Bacillus sp. PS06 TaxID=2764176 RepID=UPI00177D411E|nr:peptidoglycan DD-metalloendopeptidase family protein [Bacillus sp. PS06]MBD8071454.1 peptidoglycan DD-metalloendopeptidase family protein [Bacillus sp. PS06]
MKRRFLILSLGIIVTAGSTITPTIPTVFAQETNRSLENQKNDIENKKSGIESDIETKKSELDKIKQEQEAVNQDIKRLDLAVAETSGQIREKEAQTKETKEEIERLKEEIEVVKERIEKRDALLQDRMRSIQENGGMISYIDVLLGAQSFSDFVNRVSAVSSFVQADRDIIKVHQEDKQLLEDTEKEVNNQLVQLEEQLQQLEGMKKQLNSQISEKNEIMSKLKTEEEHMHDDLATLEDEAGLLAAQERAIQQAIEEWNRKQKEIEAERKRQEEERKRQQESGNTSGSNSGSNVSTTPAPAVTSGNFMRPTTGRVSSNYGGRWGTLHAGIDIANAAPNVPVVAAADGVVFRSYYSASYGNVVFITHNIDGKVYTTVYAHLESRSVGEGQYVGKGAMVGYMGNTGQSFGKHLHFELHVGPWNASKSNSVDPRNYINF